MLSLAGFALTALTIIGMVLLVLLGILTTYVSLYMLHAELKHHLGQHRQHSYDAMSLPTPQDA
jgi:hypothetical protein